MATKTITVDTPSVGTGDTLASYNAYTDNPSAKTPLSPASMTPAEATAGKDFTLADGLNHNITVYPVGTTSGEYNAPSNSFNVDLSSLMTIDFTAMSVGPFSTDVKAGTPDIFNNGGTNVLRLDGSSVIGLQAPSAAFSTITGDGNGFKILGEGVTFPTLVDQAYIWGGYQVVGTNPGFVMQCRANGSIESILKITSNQDNDSGTGELVAGTRYATLEHVFTNVNSNTDLKHDIVLNGTIIATQTFASVNTSNFTLTDQIYLGGRQINDAVNGGIANMLIEKISFIEF